MSTTKDKDKKDKSKNDTKNDCVPKWYNPITGVWSCFAVDGYEYVDDDDL